MGSITSAGTKLGISAAAPATHDVTGFEALAFTIIANVESVPEMGASSGVITFQPLDGPELQHKGPVSYGQLQIPMADDPADAGQILLKAASAPGNNALYSFVKISPDGLKEFWRGRAFSNRMTTGGASNIRMRNAMIGCSTTVVEKAPA